MSGDDCNQHESPPSYEELAGLLRESMDLIKHFRRENEELKRENERLTREMVRLERALDKATRAAKRQAAPFSKGKPKRDAKKPGRKPGKEYGERASRPVPDHVDRVVVAPLPEKCPCGGPVRRVEVKSQYQSDIPKVRPIVTRIDVQVGECTCCGRRIQGKHPEQSSDALGAAATQIGPNALALAAQMNKELGVPHEKIAQHFMVAFGLQVCKATLVRGIMRLGKKATPVYFELVRVVQASLVVYVDETGWKVNGVLWWLWVFVADKTALFMIEPGRGFDVAEEVLGKDFSGVLGHDGWAPYDRFRDAQHQTCLQHIDRRCTKMLETATRGAVRFPRGVKAVIKSGLRRRDKREAGTISKRGLAIVIGMLKARFRRLLHWNLSNEQNRKLQKHLRRVRKQMFTFLERPGVEATNWPAEQAIRPAVVNRKVCGGNRSPPGAHTQAVLSSVIVTCNRCGVDPIDFLRNLQLLNRRAAMAEELIQVAKTR